MSYIALYRKYRPDNFADVKGQDPIITTLKNQLITGKMAHAYLFCGSRGTGKTTIAKLFAKAVNCENPVDGNPCGVCKNCRNIANSSSLSVIEIDAASNNGVDNIRQIIEEVSYSPADGCSKKVYIIDEVHMLSASAFNALLKTLEEPPSYCIFILATTDPQKVPVTILSRCQRYDFRRIQKDVISNRLEEICQLENINADPAALGYIAGLADGGMRDALSIMDQCVAFKDGAGEANLSMKKVQLVLGLVDRSVLGKILEAVKKQNVSEVLGIFNKIVSEGKEPVQLVNDLIGYTRDLLVAKTTTEPELILEMSPENIAEIKKQAEQWQEEEIIRLIRVLSETANSIKFSTTKRVLIEVSLIKLCKPQMENKNDSLIPRIINLENFLESQELVDRICDRVMETIDISGIKVSPDSGEQYEKVPLPQALPEDLQKIVDNWPKVIADLNKTNPSHTTILKACRKSIDETGKLVIVVNNLSHVTYFRDSCREALMEIFQEITGKQVDYRVEMIKNDRELRKYPDISVFAVNPNVTIETVNETEEVEGFE